MHDRIRLERAERPRHRGGVTHIAAIELIARMVFNRGNRKEISRIGELVEVEHVVSSLRDKAPNQRRSDESGSTGDHDSHLSMPFDHAGRLQLAIAAVTPFAGAGAHPADSEVISSTSR